MGQVGWLNDTIGTRDSHAPRSPGGVLWRLAVPLLCPALAGAQSVRGVVVDQGDIPVPGVVVQLLDSASHSAARALSNDRGEFRLAAPAAGTYRVTTLRIGYSPLTTPAFTLGRTDDVSKRLVLSGVRVVARRREDRREDVVPRLRRLGGRNVRRVGADPRRAHRDAADRRVTHDRDDDRGL